MALAAILIGITGCVSQLSTHRSQGAPTSPDAVVKEKPQTDAPHPRPILSTTPTPFTPPKERHATVGPTPTAIVKSQATSKSSTMAKTGDESPEHPTFGVAYPFHETNPMKLALPWTSIAPSYTAPTLAIVQISPSSILVVKNYGDMRLAFTVSGITGYHVELVNDGGIGVYQILGTCTTGEDAFIANMIAKNWTKEQHPATTTFSSLSDLGDVCASRTNA